MANVKINMVVGGIANVRNGLRSVKDIVAQAEQAASKEAARAAKQRERISFQLAKERIRAETQVSKEFLRLSGVETKSAAAVAKEKLRIVDRAGRDRVRAEEQANKQIQRSAEQTARYIERVQLNSARNAGRAALKQAADEERAAKQRARALGSDRRGYLGAAGRGLSNVAGTALRLGGTVAALGGGFAVADVYQKSIASERAAVALSNSAFQGKPGEKRLDPQALLKTASNVQKTTGVDKGELLKGLQEYVALSGNSDLLKDEASIGRFAKLAKGSGADVGEILQSAASLASQNSQLTPEQQADMLRNVVGQGKMGAVELPDLARVAGRVAASATIYGVNDTNNQGDNQRKLLALTQIARKTSGSSDDAATAVSRFGSDVAKHAKANGLEDAVFTDKKSGKLKDPAEILAAYFEKTGGNLVKMGEGRGNLGLGVESVKIAQAVSSDYEKAKAEALAGGASAKDANKAGADAVRKKVLEFEGAKYSEKDVDDDFNAVVAEKGERINKAFQKISEVLEHRAAPFIEKLANSLENNGPKIERVLTGIADAADMFAAHPFAGLAAIVGASMAKELAAAGIAKLIRNAFTGGGGFGVGGGAGAGAAGGIGGAVPAVAAGLAVSAAGYAIGTHLGGEVNEAGWASFGESQRGGNSSADRAEKLAALNKRLTSGGKLSADDARMLAESGSYAEQELADARAEQERVKNSRTFSENAVDGIQDFVGGTKGESWEVRQRAAATRTSAAETLLRQLGAVNQKATDASGWTEVTQDGWSAVPQGGSSPKKISAEIIDTDSIKTAMTGAVKDGIEAATGTAKTDPNAPGRNVPMGARPPA